MNLPNKISLTRICLVPVFMIFIMPFPDFEWLKGINQFMDQWGIYIAGGVFIIASATDSLDGYIARSRNLVTEFGKFIDPIADKLLVTAAVIALVQRGSLNGWFAMIIIGRELFITGFRLLVAGKGIVIAANLWGKIKTIFQSVAIGFLIFEIKFVELFPWYPSDITIGDVIMLFAVVLTVLSACVYIRDNFHLLKDKM